MDKKNNKITLTAQMIRWSYPPLNKYFEFSYNDICHEIHSSFLDNFEYQTAFLNNGNIDHLPDEFCIDFYIENCDEVVNVINSYEFSHNNSIGVELILLSVIANNIRNRFYGILEGLEMDIYINEDKRKLYEFLLDNFNEYKNSNLDKSQITLFYGLTSKITIDNHDNWLYKLIKNTLYNDFTFGGRLDYNRKSKPKRPTNAPKFCNYFVYNTYLLLMGEVGSDKSLPTEFFKFILDFCRINKVNLIGRQNEVIGIKDLIKDAKKRYKNNPIPFSSIR